MVINKQDVEIRVALFNKYLESENSPIRLFFEHKYNYYAIYEVFADNMDEQHGDYNLVAGSKKECYDYIVALNKAYDLLTMVNTRYPRGS